MKLRRLLFAIAVIAILVVVFLPHNCRWRANQATAVTNLRRYVEAQQQFAEGNLAAVPGNTSSGLGDNAYADNFRNLYYGKTADGERLQLISEAMADAFWRDNANSGAPTGPGATELPRAYQGYYFMEDPSGVLPASQYGKQYALLAIPAFIGDDGGYHAFWVCEDGIVYKLKLEYPGGTKIDELVKRFFPQTPVSDAMPWEGLNYEPVRPKTAHRVGKKDAVK